MKPKASFWLIATLLLTISLLAEAKQVEKVAKIGWLTSGSPIGTDVRSEFLRRKLSRLGYIEGKNLAIEFRSSEGKVDRLPRLADELVRLKIDVIYASSATIALSRRKLLKRSRSFFSVRQNLFQPD